MTRPTWEQRISRARELGEVYPAAAEVLAFYAAIASFQRDLCTFVRSARGHAQPPGPTFRERLDLPLLLPRFPAFLNLVRDVAPAPLSALAKQVASQGPARWEKLLRNFWNRGAAAASLPVVERQAADVENAAIDPAEAEAFFARAFLQPYAEIISQQFPPAKPTSDTAVCPACNSEPVVAVLREENLGARRSFVCSLCSYEWDFPRTICPSCGEERPESLAVYTAEQFEHVRVDACDTCKTYVKSVDLTKNGLAIPVVDEIATLPLTLWAQENGYTKLQPNLMAV